MPVLTNERRSVVHHLTSKHDVPLIWHGTRDMPPRAVPWSACMRARMYVRSFDCESGRYNGMCAALDESIANITASLEDAGAMNNTVIVFISDNGGNIGSGANE